MQKMASVSAIYNRRVKPLFPWKLVAASLLLPILSLPAKVYSQSVAEVSLPDEPTPQTSSSQQTPPAPQSDEEKRRLEREQAAKDVKVQEHQKLFGVVPNYNTYNGQNAPPLSTRQKYHLALKSSVNPFAFVAAGILAGYGQATDSFTGYGQGAEGYAKRYGAAYADAFDGTLIGNAILPSLLHQDPRYFRLGKGKVMKRIGYAVAMTVVCKSDKGKWQPNYSNVLGNFASGGISNLYYPASDRGAGLTIERGFVVTAQGALGSLAVEFIPDFQNRYFNKHKSSTSSPPAVPAQP